MATILGSVFFNFRAGKYVSAGLLGAGFLTISILYGMFMFTPSGDINSSVKAGPWPPTINVCPDFLSLITLNGTAVCVDPIGVSMQNGANGLKKWNNSGNTGTDYVFDLSLNLSGQNRMTALCDQCRSKGLTWEGVFDGSACLNNQPPIPVSQ
uniref:Uncharacterized protein n=1 Tax=viral metagenome TaxID=1070528 RepID=A0A6C0JW15_9ZZZZ